MHREQRHPQDPRRGRLGRRARPRLHARQGHPRRQQRGRRGRRGRRHRGRRCLRGEGRRRGPEAGVGCGERPRFAIQQEGEPEPAAVPTVQCAVT